jgi:LynF/TruF/PatF family peptide O-prenyltransferase
MLERSCKIEGSEVFPARFYVWYHNQDHLKSLDLISHFFKGVAECPEANINFSLLEDILEKDIDLNKVMQIIAGVDLRSEIKDSRIKFWMRIVNYPEKLYQVLSMHGHTKTVMGLLIKNDLLFGIDCYFDGRTNIKLYLGFKQDDLENPSVLNKLSNAFSDKVFDLVNKSRMLFVTLKQERKLEKILHFSPYDMDPFLDLLGNHVLKETNQRMKIGDLDVPELVSLYEREINNGKIKNANIYYAPSLRTATRKSEIYRGK